jgi:Ca2+-binding EF-hand superfamily protein
MYETQPGTAERVGVSAEELAAATAEQAFEEADTDADGTLTFEEFQAWYSQSSRLYGESAAQAAQAVAEAAPSWVTLDEVRRLTGLDSSFMTDCIVTAMQLFDAMDQNQKGAVPVNTLTELASQLPKTGAQMTLAKLAGFLDMRRDGSISRSKWLFACEALFTSFIYDRVRVVTENAKNGFLQLMQYALRHPFVQNMTPVVAKYITGLESFNVREVFELFAQATDFNGLISRASFNQCFEEINNARPTKLSKFEKSQQSLFLQRLFKAFDANSAGFVDFTELSTGLSVLCSGSHDEKVGANFSLYDFNCDGVMSLEEMTNHLRSVFKVLNCCTTDSGFKTDEYARMTAEQAFANYAAHDVTEIPATSGQFMKFSEFKAWYSQSHVGLADVSTSTSTVHAPVACNRIFAFSQLEVDDMFAQLADITNDEGLIMLKDFVGSVSQMHASARRYTDPHVLANAKEFGSLFLVNSDSVDFIEISIALSLFCAASFEEQLVSIFNLLDYGNTGQINDAQLIRYFNITLRVLNFLNIEPLLLSSVPISSISALLVNNIMRWCGGIINVGNFMHWSFLFSPCLTLQDPSIDFIVKLLDFDECRRLLNVQHLSRNDLFSTFAQLESNGWISHQSLLSGVTELGKPKTHMQSVKLRLVCIILIHIFDRDESGFLSLFNVLASLAVLKCTKFEEKVESAFDIFSRSKLSRNELCVFFTSVYRVYFFMEPLFRIQAKCSAEELAMECITNSTSGIKSDHFTFLEFLSNYNIPEAMSPSKQNVTSTHDANSVDTSAWLSLAEVRRVTGLGNTNLSSAISVFASATSPAGHLHWADFCACMENLASKNAANATAEDYKRFRIAQRLIFLAFDRNNNQTLDMTEFATGLSVLCAGSQTEKIITSFSLQDINGDNFISFEEMRGFLLNTFAILGKLEPEPSKFKNIHDLAEDTARKFFREAGQSRYGLISKRKYISMLKGEDVMDVDLIRRVSGLEHVSTAAMHDILWRYMDSDYKLNLDSFASAFDELRIRSGVKSQSYGEDQFRLFIGEIFKSFENDADDSGRVSIIDLIAGISVLCAGTTEDKVKTVFSMYDLNQDGLISPNELNDYLLNIYRVTFKLQPHSLTRYAKSVEQLAHRATYHIFEAADKDTDGYLTVDEFSNWYCRYSGEATKTQQEVLADSVKSWITLHEARTLLNLHDVAVETVLRELSFVQKRSVTVTRTIFLDLMQKFCSRKSKKIDSLLHFIFNIYDEKHSSVVDFVEIATGVAVICGKNVQQNLHLAFMLYDTDGDDLLTYGELIKFVGNIFKILTQVEPQIGRDLRTEIGNLVTETVDQFLADRHLDQSSLFSFVTFQGWYRANNLFYDSSSSTISENLNISEVRRITGLGSFSVQTVFELFARATDEEGMISIDSFELCFDDLVDASGVELTEQDAENMRIILTRLYSAFDEHGDGVIDFTELSSGLSVLCAGSRDDKAAAAFALYDFTNTGYISIVDLARYLTCVFKVMFQTRPHTAQQVDETAEQMALTTAIQAFEEIGIHKNDGMNLRQFQEWCYRNGPSKPSNVNKNEHAIQADITLYEVSRLTGLDCFYPDDVFRLFTEMADENGNVTQQAFDLCIDEIVDASGHKLNDIEKKRLTNIRSKLFESFDINNNSVVDLTEIKTGLSVLCAGNRDEKAAAAFALYDYNGDGVISLDEMTRYLTCVFKVMYETQPGTAERVGVSAEELAAATAEQAFEEADTDADGTLTFEEFQAWNSPSEAASSNASDAALEISEINGLQYLINRLDSTICSYGFDKITHNGVDFVGSFGEYCETGIESHILPSWITRENATEMLGFSVFSFEAVVSLFKAGSVHGFVSVESFGRCFDELISVVATSFNADPHFYNKCKLLISRLYACFDKDGEGFAFCADILCGLQTLAIDDAVTKRRIIFDLLDTSRNGTIEIADIERYFFSFFNVLSILESSMSEHAGGDSNDRLLESVIADFADYCTSIGVETNSITLHNFESWHVIHTNQLAKAETEISEREDYVSDSLMKMRDSLNLEAVSFDELCDVVSENSTCSSTNDMRADEWHISIDRLIYVFETLSTLASGSVSEVALLHSIVPLLAAFYIYDSASIPSVENSITMVDFLLGMATFYGGLNETTEGVIRRLLRLSSSAHMSDADSFRCITMILRTGMLLGDDGEMLRNPSSVALKRAAADDLGHHIVTLLHTHFGPGPLQFDQVAQWPSLVQLESD